MSDSPSKSASTPRFINHLLHTAKPSSVTTPQGAIRQIYESGGVRILTEDNIVITRAS